MSRNEQPTYTQSMHNQPGAHNQIEQLLAIYPELAGAEERLVAGHVPSCPDCTATQAAYRRMDRALVALTTHKLQQVNGQVLNVQHFRQQLASTPTSGWFGWSTANYWPHLPLTQIAGVALLTLCCLALSFALAGWGPFNQRLLAATATPTQAAQATTLPGIATAEATATATVTQVAFNFSPVQSLAIALPPLMVTRPPGRP